MKKKLLLALALILGICLVFGACSKPNQSAANSKESKENSSNEESSNQENSELKTIKVGATPIPHAELLELVKPSLEEKGFKLEIVEFTDYTTPNLALDEKSIDANFFQHTPYMESFGKEHNLDLVNAGGIHIEPMGVYSNKIKSLDELKDGDKIAIPNDPTNGGRALLLLQEKGILKIEQSAGLEATELDIIENKLNLKVTAIDAAQLPNTLDDVTISVINSNYALDAGLNPSEDSLAIESGDSPYVNIITVMAGDENKDKIKALVYSLQSEEVKNFLEEKYKGAIVPAF